MILFRIRFFLFNIPLDNAKITNMIVNIMIIMITIMIIMMIRRWAKESLR